MKNDTIKKSGKATKATKGFELACVAGGEAGTIYPLEDGVPLTVHARFCVQKEAGNWLVRAVGGKEVLVCGEMAVESLLRPGDTIVSESGEYVFRVRRGAGSRLVGYLPAVFAVLLIVLAGKAYRWALTELEEMREEASPAHEEFLAETGKYPPTSDEAERFRRAKKARVLFVMAMGNVGDSDRLAPTVAKAVRQFEMVERIAASCTPPLIVGEEAKAARKAAQSRLKEMKDHLKNNAIIAVQTNQNGSYRECLLRLVCYADDPADADYQWAIERLRSIVVTQQ